jgi:hypothetical protein
MGNEANKSTKNNPLVRALARWENEGGSLDADWEKRAALIHEEDRILHCLGAAVIMRWNNLPTEVRRELSRALLRSASRSIRQSSKGRLHAFFTATRMRNT